MPLYSGSARFELSGRHLVTGWVLAWALLFSLPGLLPTIWGGLARLEGSHGVEMGGPNGEIRVVLTHPASCLRAHPSVHRHGPLARALTFAAVSNGERDHQLSFIRGSNWIAEAESTVVSYGEVSSPRLIVFWELEPLSALPECGAAGLGRDFAPSIPAPTGLETTRLLI